MAILVGTRCSLVPQATHYNTLKLASDEIVIFIQSFLFQTSFPMKVFSIHIVNESWVFDMIFSMFKPFLGRRYRETVSTRGRSRPARLGPTLTEPVTENKFYFGNSYVARFWSTASRLLCCTAERGHRITVNFIVLESTERTFVLSYGVFGGF